MHWLIFDNILPLPDALSYCVTSSNYLEKKYVASSAVVSWEFLHLPTQQHFYPTVSLKSIFTQKNRESLKFIEGSFFRLGFFISTLLVRRLKRMNKILTKKECCRSPACSLVFIWQERSGQLENTLSPTFHCPRIVHNPLNSLYPNAPVLSP